MTPKRVWVLGIGALSVAAIGFYIDASRPRWSRQVYFALTYALDRAEGCTFTDSISLRLSDSLQEQMARIAAGSSSAPSEHEGILRWQTPFGEFWTPTGTGLPFLLAEQALDLYERAGLGVKPGDVVLDCGANVGTFTRHALNAQAKQVIAIEPSPRNAYCLRKTFRTAINEGKVVIVEAALWHEPGSMELFVFDNSALDSLVMRERIESSVRGTPVKVPLTTIDILVADLGIERVHFIKMDIEGAERNALRGAAETIRKHHPGLSIATENLPDDIRAIPEAIRTVVPTYTQVNGSCRMIRFMTLRPEVVHFMPNEN